jgi:hypothetical protein
MHRKGMFRQLELLHCPTARTRDKSEDWLTGEHSILMKKLPGLEDLRIYFTHVESIFGPPFCDCFLECYFQDRRTLEKAHDSEIMKSHLDELKANGFAKATSPHIVWAEENIIEIPEGPRAMHHNKGKYCQMGTLKCSHGMPVSELKRWWLEEHAETGKHLEGLQWYTVLFPVKDAPYGVPPFDGYASVWYDSVEALKKAAVSKIMQGQMEDVRRHKMDRPDLSKVVLADEYIIHID